MNSLEEQLIDKLRKSDIRLTVSRLAVIPKNECNKIELKEE